MQQVTFLHSKNGTSVICDDAQASIFASWYNIHRKACDASLWALRSCSIDGLITQDIPNGTQVQVNRVFHQK